MHTSMIVQAFIVLLFADLSKAADFLSFSLSGDFNNHNNIMRTLHCDCLVTVYLHPGFFFFYHYNDYLFLL